MLKGMGSLPKDIQNVVWLQTSFIGDIVLTTAAMQLLKKKVPAVRQYLITTPIGAQALARQSLLQDILVWDKRQEFLLTSGKRLRADLADRNVLPANSVLLQAHKSVRSSLLRRLIGLPTVTYFETHLGAGAFRVPRVALLHEAARIAMLLQPLGFSRKDIIQAKPYLEQVSHLSPDINARFENLPGKTVKIGLAPGSVWQTKRWPSAYFAKLVQSLMATYPDAVIVLLGAAGERKEAQEIVDNLPEQSQARLIDLVGQTKLGELPAIYAQLDLLVSNDSSPIHYASALNVPTLAIFGATVPAMGFYPLANGSQVAERAIAELTCRPCSDHGPKRCPLKHFKCMRELGPDLLMPQLREILEQNARSY